MQNYSAEENRRRAEARFERATSRAREAADAIKDFEASKVAEADKLVRLRSLRLAKEAADAHGKAERVEEERLAGAKKPSRPRKAGPSDRARATDD